MNLTRRKKTFWGIFVLLACGMLYAVFVSATGIAIPCVFHRITGLWCPGCGITRMFIRLFRLDIYGAFRSNPLLFITLPLLAAAIIRRLYTLKKYGDRRKDKWIEKCLIAYVVILIAYGVLRNIEFFSFLAPA